MLTLSASGNLEPSLFLGVRNTRTGLSKEMLEQFKSPKKSVHKSLPMETGNAIDSARMTDS